MSAGVRLIASNEFVELRLSMLAQTPAWEEIAES
jgi:hypothetical protein